MSSCGATTPPLRNNDNEWTESQLSELVRLYRCQPSLWKKDDPAYLDSRERRLAYEYIRDNVNRSKVGLVEVILKIRELRSVYVDEWKKMVEAMSTRETYEPELHWFNELNDFLYDNLHVDEVDSIEDLAKGCSSYSSNYCEDSPSSGLISASKASCCLSETWPDDDNNNNNNALEIPRGKNSCCRCHSTRFTGRAGGSLIIATRRWAKSEPLVCRNEAIQGQAVERKNEGSMSSTRSRLTVRKSCDEYDLFAKRIACRLKQMNPELASKVQWEIESILINAELNLDINTSASSAGSTFMENRVDPNNSRTFSILPHSKSRICESLASSLHTEGKV